MREVLQLHLHPQAPRTLTVEKPAACASSGWLFCCSNENSCIRPFASAGLQQACHAKASIVLRATAARAPRGEHRCEKMTGHS